MTSFQVIPTWRIVLFTLWNPLESADFGLKTQNIDQKHGYSYSQDYGLMWDAFLTGIFEEKSNGKQPLVGMFAAGP